jgi:hypothetical protein
MQNTHLLIDDDLRRLIIGLDGVAVGLTDLQANPMLDDYPSIQFDLHHYTDIVKHAADLLAIMREQHHR